MAVVYNTNIDQGADWFINFYYNQPDGTPVNVGLFACHATAEQTTLITNGKYAYDIEITAPVTGVVTRLCEGTVQVIAQVTRT